MSNRTIAQCRCQDKINANNLFFGLHLALENGKVEYTMKKEVDVTTKEIIEKLEKKGLNEMGRRHGRTVDKVRIIRYEIARECAVSFETVKNWAYGSQEPGKQAGKLLINYAERQGVI